MWGASGGRLLAWGGRSATSWWQTGSKGLSTAANTDLKAVLAEKIPAQQVRNPPPNADCNLTSASFTALGSWHGLICASTALNQ